MLDFTGQVVLVTGAGSARGLGRATALTFAKQGAAVVICDINEEGLKRNVAEIEETGAKACGIVCNLTDEESVKKMIDEIMTKFGRLDVLVNNAGITQKVTVADMSMADMQRIFAINMFGLFSVTKFVSEIMKKQNYGRIVSLSSVSAKRGGGVFGGAHYSASKAAVLGFSKNLARELAKYNVTVNCVAPGFISTEINASLSEEQVADIVATIPAGRTGVPQDVANAIVFLASKEASYITGEEIDINGGSHMD